MNIHAFVKNTDHLNFGIGRKVVKNHMTLKRILAHLVLFSIMGYLITDYADFADFFPPPPRLRGVNIIIDFDRG